MLVCFPGAVPRDGEGIREDAVCAEAADPREPQSAGLDLQQPRHAPRRADSAVRHGHCLKGGTAQHV